MILAPTNLTATAVNSRAFVISWTAATDANRYLIWYSLDNIYWSYLANSTSTTYTLSGAASGNHRNNIFENLGPDRTILFRVASCNSTTFELSADYATLAVVVPNFELAPPSNLQVTGIGTGGVKLTWTATTNSTKQYMLQYKVNDGSWSNTGTSWGPSANTTSGTYPDTTGCPTLQLNSDYTFRLKTCISTTGADLGKSSDWIYSDTVRTPAQCELSAPTNLAKSGTSPSYTWTWNAVPGASNYHVSGYVFNGSGGSIPSYSVTTNSYTGSSTYTGTRFAVSAFNKTTLARSEPSFTFVSDVAIDTIKLTAPFKTATSIGIKVDHPGWLDYAKHITVEFKKVSDTVWTTVERIPVSYAWTPLWINDLEPGTAYQFRAYHLDVFQNNTIPAATTLNVTTHSSEFAFGYCSTGVTTGFIAALVSAETVKFYHSTTGTGFTLKSQIAIQRPCFYFDDSNNLAIVAGKGVLFTSKDSVNWRKIAVCGRIRSVQFDHATQKYMFFNEIGHYFMASESELERATVLGPFIASNAEGHFAKFYVHDTSENAFVLTDTNSYCKF